jgi:transcriptional regulator with XRE-family HTH domain
VRIPSLAKSLRAEIRRVAAREIERALKPLRRVQKQVRSLKTSSTKGRRSLARIERRLAGLRAGRPAAGTPGRPGRRVAVGGDDIRALRARLGMTRLQFAKLIDVSPGSVFGWEKGKTTPRGATVARLGEAKKLGVRAARARVEAASPGVITSRKSTRKAGVRRRKGTLRSRANRSRRAA